MSNAITRKTHFGQVVQVEHQGAVVSNQYDEVGPTQEVNANAVHVLTEIRNGDLRWS